MSSPLTSLKILDFSTLLPGPYATMMLADLGAEVLRIEAPGRPELTRMFPPFDADGNSSQHAMLNRSKRSLGLNLKAEGATDIVKKLISDQGYNIVIEQFRPGVMDRLGVGYDTLKAVCPDLIFCSLTGYGQDGPFRDRAGHDVNYLALSGLLSYYGRAGEAPPPLPMQVADVGAGSLNMVIGLLASVIRRTATGEGGTVDISMHDGSLAWNNIGAANTIVSGGHSPSQESTALNGGSFYDLYKTKDGRLLSVGSLEPKFWSGFCQAIGREDLFKTGTNYDVAIQKTIKPEIQAAILEKTLAEWVEIFAKLDVCVEPVLTTAESLEHPHTVARNMLVDVPMRDGTPQQQIGTPIKLSNHEPEYKFTGTALGMHSKEILSELGYTDDEIEAFYSSNMVAGGSH
ncbi:MAG: alpha-methylacyl-CoA racemase [Cellvibrionaceae bacterium]|jgi:alpha-methylacyl-CoA racemase